MCRPQTVYSSKDSVIQLQDQRVKVHLVPAPLWCSWVVFWDRTPAAAREWMVGEYVTRVRGFATVVYTQRVTGHEWSLQVQCFRPAFFFISRQDWPLYETCCDSCMYVRLPLACTSWPHSALYSGLYILSYRGKLCCYCLLLLILKV